MADPGVPDFVGRGVEGGLPDGEEPFEFLWVAGDVVVIDGVRAAEAADEVADRVFLVFPHRGKAAVELALPAATFVPLGGIVVGLPLPPTA